MPSIRFPSRLALAVALSATVPFAHAATPQAESAAMHEEDVPARTSVEGEGAMLELAFDPNAGGDRLAVRYRITNTGDAALAVFDRGNRQAVLAKRQNAGDVPAPMFDTDGGDVTLSHVAMPLPTPSPTVPPVPLAARLVPGEAHDGAFEFDLALAGAPSRVRWCLGVAPFDEAASLAAESTNKVAVWTVSFEIVERQQRLCSPWYDIAGGVFVAD